jgi:hypothetical protein
MHDIKNFWLAWVSTASSLFAAIEMKTVMTIVSAVVLPVIFFTIGKTVDVLVQIYFRRRDMERTGRNQNITPQMNTDEH